MQSVATEFTCINVVAVNRPAFVQFISALLGAMSNEWPNPADDCICRIYGAKHAPKNAEGEMSTWERAGTFPFNHVVANKLVTVANEAPLIIPLDIALVLSPRLCGIDEESTKPSLYSLLTPFRVIAGFDQDRNRTLPKIIVLGFCKPDFNRKAIFERIVTEALVNWPKPSIHFISSQNVREEIEKKLICESIWTPEKEKVDIERRIIEYFCQGMMSLPMEEAKDLDDLTIRYLNKRHFIITPRCHLTHRMHAEEHSEESSLIDVRKIWEIIEEIGAHSEVARKAFDKHGLIPARVVFDVLDELGGSEQWLPLFRHYGIFILPAEIKCFHKEHDDQTAANVEPRENYMLPVSLPEPAQKAFIVPHILSSRKLPEKDPESYRRTEAFIVRHKGGHRISEGLFYFLVAIFIKHYPEAPHCYYQAARLRVQRDHILEVKLKDDVMYASMLVRTSDELFRSTSTARVCRDIKGVLKADAVTLSESYLATELQFGALMTTHDHMEDFVDLNSQILRSSGPIYSEEGEEFHPPKSLYLWFDSGPKGTLIEKSFAKLCEEMNQKKIIEHLIEKNELTANQYKEILNNRDLVSPPLLLQMIARKKDCDELLWRVLNDTGQTSLAELLIPVKSTPRSPSPLPSQDLSRMPAVGNLDKRDRPTIAQPTTDENESLNALTPTNIGSNVKPVSTAFEQQIQQQTQEQTQVPQQQRETQQVGIGNRQSIVFS